MEHTLRYTIFVLLISSSLILGQDIAELSAKIDKSRPGESQFLLRGYAHSGFEKIGEVSKSIV